MAKVNALIPDGRWFIPSDKARDYVGDTVLVRWLERVGRNRCRVQLCEQAFLPTWRALQPGATRTIDADEYVEFDDDDFE